MSWLRWLAGLAVFLWVGGWLALAVAVAVALWGARDLQRIHPHPRMRHGRALQQTRRR